MKEAALWTFGIAAAFGVVWLFADVYAARKHMREAIREARAYRVPSSLPLQHNARKANP